jgi:hypothetical protein
MSDDADLQPGMDEQDQRGLTRDQLYELVWSEPVRKVAQRFGLSDRGLAKLCERHAIPVPGRGYWRLKETGHRVRRLPLPELHPNHQQLAAVRLPEPQAILQPRPRPEPPPDPPRVAAQRAFESANPLVVGDLPAQPHPLVRATRTGLRKLKEGSPERRHALDLTVTAATRERALRILEVLCRAFKERGWPVATHQGDRQNSQIEVHGVKVAFSLEERLQRQERPKPKPIDLLLTPSLAFQERYDYVPTGELVLKAWHDVGSKSEWADGKRQRVEEKLNEFMIAVVRIADNEIRWQEERAIRERQRQEEERARWERERRQGEENRRGEDLVQLANRWREAELLRTFIATARAKPGSDPETSPSDSQFHRWLRWAESYADQLDPFSAPGCLPPPYLRRTPWDTQGPGEWPSDISF